MTMPHVEVITSVESRRRWSREEKERLVAASFEPGVSISEVARSAGIHVSQLFRWRKDLCDRVDAGSSQLVPVEIVAAAATPAVGAPASSAVPGRRRRKSGIIEIELGGGRRIRVDRDVDAEASAARSGCVGSAMIPVPSGVRVWLATGHTDMRKGFPGLALMVQETLKRDPHSGHLFCLPRSSRRSDQGDLARRPGCLSVLEEAGARPLHLAVGGRRRW